MKKVAIIDKQPYSLDYSDFFPDFDFDLYHLSSTPKKKILKKDIDLDFDINLYDFIILVGAEACKFIGKITSVTKYQGYLMEEKFLPLTNPAMIELRPDAKPAFDKAVRNIIGYIINTKAEVTSYKCTPINETKEAYNYIYEILKSDVKVVVLDTETTALYPRNGYILGISIAYKEDEGVYINTNCIDEEIEYLLQILINKVTIVFHNAKFDIKMLKYHFNFIFRNWDCTLLLHYILNEQPGTHELKQLAIQYTDLGDYDKELEDYKKKYCRLYGIKITDFTYDLIPFEVMYPYACKDAITTLQLYNQFFPKVQNRQEFKQVYNILKRGTKAIYIIEENGVPFDKEELKNAQIELDNKIYKAEKSLYDFKEVHELEQLQKAKFNPGSVTQLRKLFFEVLKLEPTGIKTDKGEHSCNAEAMEILATQHKLPQEILQIRKERKIKNTYIDKILLSLDTDNRLRTNFNLTTTTSGRLSSSGKLNMQQLPRDNKIVKKCIKAKEGWKIVSHDLKTAEMYIAAVLSKDKVLQDIFIKGEDYHGSMAKYKFDLSCAPNEVAIYFPELRQSAKTISFEILYKLNYREPALQRFKTLRKWLESQEKFISNNGFIFSFFGRKRRLSNIFSPDRQVAQHEVRSGVNFLVQSVSSDINLLAAIDMVNYIVENKLKAKIFALVHDSILAEVPDEELEEYNTKLKYFMQKNRGISIPNCPIGVDIEVGTNYAFI